MMAAALTLDRSMASKSEVMTELAKCVSPGTVLRCDEPLARRTTLRVGGAADLFVEPASEQDLAAVLKFSKVQNLPWFVLGRGSNLLVKDGGFRGIVVSLSRPHFARIEVNDGRLRCGAGAKLKAVAVEAKRNSLAGLEFLEGIPGSVGGGLRMNAGAMGAAMFDIVESVRLMDQAGTCAERSPAELEVAYRGCATFKTHIALSAALRGRPNLRETIDARMHEFSQKRWRTQPAAPSAGCMFKNPANISAGRLIEELGLKGTRIGGAMVSTTHGNFIVTENTATARDVLDLIDLIRQRALAERGIDLETEVEIIGEWA